MQQSVILDKLSEFLMVEQGGLELYRVAASRSQTPALKARYKSLAHKRRGTVRCWSI
jgi:hypothetical protein